MSATDFLQSVQSCPQSQVSQQQQEGQSQAVNLATQLMRNLSLLAAEDLSKNGRVFTANKVDNFTSAQR